MTAQEMMDLLNRMDNRDKNQFLDMLYDKYFDKGIPIERILEESRIVEATIMGNSSKPGREVLKGLLPELLAGSHTEALSGTIESNDEINLEELRAERLSKYECTKRIACETY